MNYIQKLGLMLATISLVVACSIIDNRVNLANQKLTNEIDSLSNHLCKFTDFKKTDGKEYVKDGSTMYDLYFDGFISAQQDCLFDTRGGYNYVDATLKSVTPSKDTSHPHFLSAGSNYGYPVKGTATFIKRDSGWNLVGWGYSFHLKE